jgi:hypothetical protein
MRAVAVKLRPMERPMKGADRCEAERTLMGPEEVAERQERLSAKPMPTEGQY